MARRFGIEMEFSTNKSSYEIATALATKGLEIQNVGGYGHSSGHLWELKTDSSASHPNHGRGYELASRILEGDQGLKEVDWYAKALNNLRNEHDFKVNRQCGIHLHVDVSDFTEQQFRNLIRLVMYFEPVIFGINPPSRKGNRYCKAIQGQQRFEELAGMHGDLTPEQVRQSLEVVARDRYFGLNVTKYMTQGRIEFRYGAASLNPKKILGWVSVLLAIVEKAKSMTRCRFEPNNNTKTLSERKDDLRRILGTLRQNGITYKVALAPSVLDERFDTFSQSVGDQVPVYGRA